MNGLNRTIVGKFKPRPSSGALSPAKIFFPLNQTDQGIKGCCGQEDGTPLRRVGTGTMLVLRLLENGLSRSMTLVCFQNRCLLGVSRATDASICASAHPASAQACTSCHLVTVGRGFDDCNISASKNDNLFPSNQTCFGPGTASALLRPADVFGNSKIA